MRMKVSLAIVLLFCLLPPTALAQELIKNGGFELNQNGCPEAWTCSIGASATVADAWPVSSQVITPHSGQVMTVIAPGGFGDQEIWQEVDFTGYSLATLSFWWRYEAIDFDEQDNGRDAFEVWVGNPSDANSWERIWESPINVDPSDGPVVSPWMLIQVAGDVTEISKLTFRFHLRNAADGGEPVIPDTDPPPPQYTNGQRTIAFLDDVSIEASVSVTSFLDRITADVRWLLEHGVLAKGEANSLSVKLDAAIRSIGGENTVAATGQLGAFVNEVTALERSRRLSSEFSQALIARGNAAIDFLSAQ